MFMHIKPAAKNTLILRHHSSSYSYLFGDTSIIGRLHVISPLAVCSWQVPAGRFEKKRYFYWPNRYVVPIWCCQHASHIKPAAKNFFGIPPAVSGIFFGDTSIIGRLHIVSPSPVCSWQVPAGRFEEKRYFYWPSRCVVSIWCCQHAAN